MRARPAVAVASATLAVALLATLAGCGTRVPAAQQPPGAASHFSPASTPPPAASTATLAPTPAPREPDGATRLLPGTRVVAYYGVPDTPGLGVLGTASAEGIWPRLAGQAAAYRSAGTTVLPAYELITDVIQQSAGADGDYEVQLPAAKIRAYLAAAHAHHALLILDIQPGRSSFLPLARALAPYLADPSVGLALDPEWRLAAGQVPDHQVGTVSVAELNATSAWLDAFTRGHHLPQKLLLIHQFQTRQIAGETGIANRPALATVVNMDGFGSRAEKLASYRAVDAATPLPLGFKLFFHADSGMFTAAQILALNPRPVVVEYE